MMQCKQGNWASVTKTWLNIALS